MSETNVDNTIHGREFLVLLGAIIIRWCISLHSYSGQNTPPMYGDYEAQRHWMEITYNIPITDWYKNTTDNDLMYWGLDYPPLTAYHSYICGWIASIVNPDFVKLYTSRGYESYIHKLFMRYTVLIPDILIFVPAMYYFFNTHAKKETTFPYKTNQKNVVSYWMYIYLGLFYPGIILIDHGHFQYNCISLGLFIASVAVLDKNDSLSAFLFCLSVNYKQMELYHALPFFVYYLGKFFNLLRFKSVFCAFKMLFRIGSIVLITFLIIWCPFITNFINLSLVLNRIFPVARGVFEDKVSNFWCIFNVVYKFRSGFSNEIMFKMCMYSTALAIMPTLYNLFVNQTHKNFILALINCSLSFFLFSFQVHEKSILLVAIPVMFYMPTDILFSFWFLLISVFSMVPLLIKDNLFLPYFALVVIYYFSFVSFSNSKNIFNKSNFNKYSYLMFLTFDFKTCIFNISFIGSLCLSLITKFVIPPAKYPDLWSLLVSFYSFCHFIGFLLYFNYIQFQNEQKVVNSPASLKLQ